MWYFLLGSVVVYNTVAFFIRKKLSIQEIYSSLLFALFLDVLVDTFASFEYEAWGFFHKDRAEYAALWIILGIYPACALLITNWFPFHSSWWIKFMYIMAWALYSTFYEWLTLELDILWHANGWNLWYSFLVYPPMYTVLLLHLWFVRKLYSKEKLS